MPQWKVLRSVGSRDYFALATLAKNRSKADIAFASWATGLQTIQADRVWRMLSFGGLDLWGRVQGVHTEVRRWPRAHLPAISRHCAKINKCFVLLRCKMLSVEQWACMIWAWAYPVKDLCNSTRQTAQSIGYIYILRSIHRPWRPRGATIQRVHSSMQGISTPSAL